MSKETGTKMPGSTYQQIITAAKPFGWRVDMVDGRDRYKKLVTLKKKEKVVCIDQDVGFSGQGELKYLKVAVHPEEFKPGLVDPVNGITELINRVSKKNWFHHSGYDSFLHVGGGQEPAAMAYRVSDINALERLLRGAA